MNQTFRNIILLGIALAVFAGIALLVARSGLLTRLRSQNIAESSPGPLLDTPLPTTYPFGVQTPFPLITFATPSGSSTPRVSATPNPLGGATASPKATLTPTPKSSSSPVATASGSAEAKSLPKTGFETWQIVLMAPVVGLGLYLFKKYKLV
jgi:hypothetical protein